MRDLFLKAVTSQNKSGKIPIWCMRQAGRYMPSYRALRQKYSFLGLCKHPKLICEATELPLREFDFDAAILFSDILLILEALGGELSFDEEKGPQLAPAFESESHLEKMNLDFLNQKLSFVFEAIRLLKSRLDVPLIGFAGSPFTLAAYLIEGGRSADFRKTKLFMLREPKLFTALLDKLCEATILFLNESIEAGCDAIQIFDSLSYQLTPHHFQQFSFLYTQKVFGALKACPKILFCRGTTHFIDPLAQLKIDALGVDTQADLSEMRKKVGPKMALQGNLDPQILLAGGAPLARETIYLLEKMNHDPGYIFNLGHGVLPQTSSEAVSLLVQTVRDFS